MSVANVGVVERLARTARPERNRPLVPPRMQS